MSGDPSATDGPRPTTRRHVWEYGIAALLGSVLVALLCVWPLVSGQRSARQVERDDSALREVLDLRATLADWQVFMEPQLSKLSASAVVLDPNDIARGSQLGQAVVAQSRIATGTLREMGLGADAAAIASSSDAFSKALTALGPLVAGRPLAVIAATVTAERTTFTQARTVTATAAAHLQAMRDIAASRTVRYLDNSRTTVLVSDAVAALLSLLAASIIGQRLHHREHASQVLAKRQTYEATLQDALGMARTEAESYAIMTRALRESVPHLRVEMLVADSSGAHFRRTFQTTDETEPQQPSGCGVSSPTDCPATQRGHTLVFPTSNALNACPHLVDRPSGDLSAACVSVSITGRSSGVVHAMGPDREPPDENDLGYLEITTRRAGERIAMLRAFEKSETQARTDPLTGLWNRRSLDNRMRQLAESGVVYTVAYGDLDHFKMLNDAHGHEAGDQALRLFARVVRDSVRPDDITARYGGEEFVIVFPDCPVDTATKILERLREQLALTLSNGRVPPFTVSFGLASSSDADTFDDVVAVADTALLTAKANGRNRTVRAGEVVPGVAAYANTDATAEAAPRSTRGF